MESHAPKSQPEAAAAKRPVLTLPDLLKDCDEAEISLSNITAMMGLICTGRDQISDPRRLAVFCRLVRSAEHELEAATRPRANGAS